MEKRKSPRYSEAMKKAWAKKTPEERKKRGQDLAKKRWNKKSETPEIVAE